MNDQRFWQIIALLDWDQTGDDEAVMAPAVQALAKHSAAEIHGFQEILATKLFGLDTLAHAREIGEDAYTGPDDFFSVDAFLYARCAVVANGQEVYDSILQSPAGMPKDLEFESLLTLASLASEAAGYGELEVDTTVSFETFSNREGWRSNG